MRILITLALICCCVLCRSQNYPVQLNAQLIPPYSPYLPDYCDPTSEKLRIQLTLLDLTEPYLDIRLRIRITGNGFSMETMPSFNPEPVRLSPGIPASVSGELLMPYFETENLLFSGLDPGEYEENKVLPEGFYSICITALDHWGQGGQEVSNEICLQALFLMNEPPVTGQPVCGGNVMSSQLQNMLFQWTPMHLSSPNMTEGTEYEFSLWEIFPSEEDPNLAVMTLPPLFTTRTQNTFYQYTVSDPALVEGKKYAWRVRALELSGRDWFLNYGYSTVCTFIYGDPFSNLGNDMIPELIITPTSHRQLYLSWNTFSFYQSYAVQLRKSGAQNWFSWSADNGSLKINDLEPGTSYEGRVRGILNNNELGGWSEVKSASTFHLPVYSCNDQNLLPDLLQHQPLRNAFPGMIIKTGQFEMQIRDVTQGTQPGYFSGTGKIKVAFGFNLDVEFHSIFISDNQTHLAGQIHAVTEGISNWAHQWEYDDAYFFNGSVDSVFTNNGLVYIINENGDTTLLTDYSGGLLITDANGNQWVVNPDGSVTPVNGGGLLPVSGEPLSAQELSILRSALLIIRNECTDQRIDSLLGILNAEESRLDQHINTQRAPYSNPVAEEGDAIFLGASYHSGPSSQPTDGFHTAYKLIETQYNEDRILHFLSRELDTDEELNFLGKYLTVEGTPFKTYVSSQLASGRTPDQVAYSTSLLGIRELVKKVVKKKVTPR